MIDCMDGLRRNKSNRVSLTYADILLRIACIKYFIHASFWKTVGVWFTIMKSNANHILGPLNSPMDI